MGRGIWCVAVLAVATVASAQPKSDAVPLLGAQAQVTGTAGSGFVDDVVASDGDRFGYVIADGTNTAALHVATIGKPDEQIIDISTITLQPIAMTFVGPRLFVVGINEGKQVAALVELESKTKKKAGTALYRVGPAEHITLITRDGKQRVAVHHQAEQTGNTTHTVELVAIETGRRVAAGKALVVDGQGTDKKLDFRVNHWSAGWTRAHGIKAGEWDRKENQKATDQEAVLDLVTGKVEKTKITDLFDQKRRFAALATANGQLDFLRMSQTNTSIELWRAGKMAALALDQKLTDYDPKSLQFDGDWFALKVDPVNADAVARKRADPEYLDIFKITDGKAIRKARVLAKGVRHRFGVAGERFWLLERNAGFERGGKSVTLYTLTP
jgi:hypothetical protein